MSLEEVIAESVASSVEKALSESVKHITELASDSAKVCKYSLDDMLTEQETAEFLKISIKTLQQWRFKKINIPFYNLGAKAVRYKFSDILQFATSNKVYVKLNQYGDDLCLY